MRVLALDIGEKRIGIAGTDVSGKIAMPIKVLPANEVISCAKSFMRIVHDVDPQLLLCGIPYTLAGEEGPQALHIKQVSQEIAHNMNLPLEYTDERLSSSEAKRMLRESGMKEKQMRGKVDMIAASIFLQSWLDSQDQ